MCPSANRNPKAHPALHKHLHDLIRNFSAARIPGTDGRRTEVRVRQPHLVRTHCVQVIRDRRQPALCRTYNPHLFPKTAKSSKQPVFSGSELKLPMLRLRGVTAAFRGSFCRQTQAPFLRVQRRPDCLWARSGCHQTVPASLDLVLDRSISTGLFRSGRLRPARAADPALQVAMVIPINSSAAVVRWVVVAPWIRTLTSRGAEDVKR